MAASRNPVLARAGFDDAGALDSAAGATMTLAGTIWKTLLLLGIAAMGTLYAWSGMPGIGLSDAAIYPLMIGGFVAGVALLLATSFNPEIAVVTGPVYAALQGVVLGVVTMVLNVQYPGLPYQALVLTTAVLLVMLTVYRTGLITVTDQLRSIIISCTGAIFMFYVIAFGMSLFGLYIPFLHEGGLIGIGFSLFVVGLAAFNLLLDFDLIERGIGKAPAQLEWFAAFGLVVTLIWMYFEILRLLRKLQR